ncbi:hypothetical protein EON80_13225 [bacterium]|nr:MAG: hypothetical protein EON80_13225 [bacterium]
MKRSTGRKLEEVKELRTKWSGSGLHDFAPMKGDIGGVMATNAGTFLLNAYYSNVVTGAPEAEGACFAVAASDANDLVAGGRNLTVWKVVRQSGSKSVVLKKQWDLKEKDNPPAVLKFSETGDVLVAGFYNGQAKGYRARDGELLWASPVPKKLPMSTLPAQANTPTGQYSPLSSEGHPGDVKFYFPLCVIPGRNEVAYSNGVNVQICQIESGKTVRVLPRIRVDSLAVSVDGKKLAMSNANGKGEAGLEIVDVASGRSEGFLPRSYQKFFHLAFSPDGRQIAGAGSSHDTQFEIWTLR